MKIEVVKSYYGIKKGDIFECLMKIISDNHRELYLVPVPMGARAVIEDEDEVIFKSEQYDEEVHLAKGYAWLSLNEVKEVQLDNNQQAKHLLSKEEF